MPYIGVTNEFSISKEKINEFASKSAHSFVLRRRLIFAHHPIFFNDACRVRQVYLRIQGEIMNQLEPKIIKIKKRFYEYFT